MRLMALYRVPMSSMSRPVIFGEVLFDRFPDGNDVLGGAPFNVAWHLSGFGGDPLLVSRVGDDEAGARVIGAMEEWGMATEGVQTDRIHPTGTVSVQLAHGQPQFEILPDQAYDYINPDGARDSVSGLRPGLMYGGTLALRAPRSRAAFEALAGECASPQFVDINLRDPWWDEATLTYAFERARWLKLNDVELQTVVGREVADADIPRVSRELCKQHQLEWLIVTRGANGAGIFGEDVALHAPAPQVPVVADTVGAGDAFSAVVISGLLARWVPGQILRRALDFAARICAQHGATAPDRQLYETTLEQWHASNQA